MLVWIILFLLISIYNTVYGFLPSHYQKKKWIRGGGYIAAVALLIYGSFQVIASYANESYATVMPDGTVTISKNFEWKIIPGSSPDDGAPLFTIKQRYGDASDIEVIPHQEIPFEKYLSSDGLVIKFFCEKDDVPKFKIIIK